MQTFLGRYIISLFTTVDQHESKQYCRTGIFEEEFQYVRGDINILPHKTLF